VVQVGDSGAGQGGEPRPIRQREHGPVRVHRVNLRLSAEEAADLGSAAYDAGMTPGGYAAHAALATARRTATPTFDDGVDQLRMLGRELMAAYTALNRVGTNLNQIAARLNVTGRVGAELAADLAPVLRQVEARSADVDTVIKQVRRALRPPR
jgi:hypothetical protein